jgi:23S rRNA (guanosine2251-2'-O)-methyltransferase
MSSNVQLVFGVNPVLETLQASPRDILEILVSQGGERPVIGQIEREAERHSLRVVRVQSALLDRLVGGQRHQGVIARVRAYAYWPLEDLLQKVSTTTGPSWILLLDGLTDPRNFGALLRTSEAVGINHVIIPKDRSVGVTPVVVKTSAGAVHHLKISKVTNLRRVIGALKQRGYWAVGLDSESRESIYDKHYPDRLAIVLGSEGRGIRPIHIKECDFVVSIPMLGKIASLNVAVAGAVFLYELVRQKGISERKEANKRG